MLVFPLSEKLLKLKKCKKWIGIETLNLYVYGETFSCVSVIQLLNGTKLRPLFPNFFCCLFDNDKKFVVVESRR